MTTQFSYVPVEKLKEYDAGIKIMPTTITQEGLARVICLGKWGEYPSNNWKDEGKKVHQSYLEQAAAIIKYLEGKNER